MRDFVGLKSDRTFIFSTRFPFDTPSIVSGKAQMIRTFAIISVAIFLCACSQTIPAGTSMNTYGYAFAPPAFREFCQRDETLCSTRGGDGIVELTAALGAELRVVNHSVNTRIRERSDMATAGKADDWRLASTEGDCEDFAITKKKELLERGWPASALLLTVVRPRFSNAGHTVLTVRTSKGDLILDSLAPRVKPWSATSYRFFARQSPHGGKEWERLS
jgi:predicted transglutaminase-like cysteine proteinase